MPQGAACMEAISWVTFQPSATSVSDSGGARQRLSWAAMEHGGKRKELTLARRAGRAGPRRCIAFPDAARTPTGNGIGHSLTVAIQIAGSPATGRPAGLPGPLAGAGATPVHGC